MDLERCRIDAPVAEVERAKLTPIPWPEGLAPVASPVSLGDGPLPPADVLVVTWTEAEAQALADVLTPGTPLTRWTPYVHNYDSFLPKLREGAPAREAHNLGLVCGTSIGGRRVLCVKSSLHMSQDGPDFPMPDWWAQVIAETGASLVISTGTAGGIGARAVLGDVIVTRRSQFDCKERFASRPWAKQAFVGNAWPPASAQLGLFSRLASANGSQLPAADRPPVVVVDSDATPAWVLTTDFFAFDDAEDHYGLRSYNPEARVVEMGDAVLGLACSRMAYPPEWVVVRNVSDPQIPQLAGIEAEAKDAAGIYLRYGYWTTVCSAIVCWALIAGS